jgi:hypothetical protein
MAAANDDVKISSYNKVTNDYSTKKNTGRVCSNQKLPQ